MEAVGTLGDGERRASEVVQANGARFLLATPAAARAVRGAIAVALHELDEVAHVLRRPLLRARRGGASVDQARRIDRKPRSLGVQRGRGKERAVSRSGVAFRSRAAVYDHGYDDQMGGADHAPQGQVGRVWHHDWRKEKRRRKTGRLMRKRGAVKAGAERIRERERRREWKREEEENRKTRNANRRKRKGRRREEEETEGDNGI